MVTCRTYTIEKAPTPGFTLIADQYEGAGSFNTTLHISYPAGAGQIVKIVNSDPISGDSCLTADIPLDGNGNATVPYSVTGNHIIYVIKATGTGGENCCTSFSQTLCQYSNYVSFTVTPAGNVEFISIPESGAEIWLAPSPGQTPENTLLTTTDTVPNLIAGTYDYIIKKAGYNDISGSVTTLENLTATVTVSMTPAEGCIYFTSSPPGAQIFLDTAPATVVDTGFVTPKLICGLSLGQHCYKLVLAGYEDKAGCIMLGVGEGAIIVDTLRELPMLAYMTISPTNPSVVINGTQLFSAIPIDQYDDPFPATVAWSNSNSFVGNIDVNTGLFTALHTGTTIVTAASGSVNKSTTVTVTPVVPTLATITISPATTSITVGSGAMFVAYPKDQFDDPIAATIVWNSSATNIGTIDQNGVFLAIAQGTTVITATSGTVSGVAIANVTSGVQPPVEAGMLGGSLETAALILGLSAFATVLVYKQAKIKILERVD